MQSIERAIEKMCLVSEVGTDRPCPTLWFVNNVRPAIDHEKNVRGERERERERRRGGREGNEGGRRPFSPRVSQNLGTWELSRHAAASAASAASASAFAIDAAFQTALLAS